MIPDKITQIKVTAHSIFIFSHKKRFIDQTYLLDTMLYEY
jgi:hypothetical protein